VIEAEYRYSLTRQWSDVPKTAVFIMLNPSTADAEFDDRTIVKCTKFAASHGCGRMEIVNLFAFRATKPSDLKQAHTEGRNIIGQKNDEYLTRAVRGADIIFLACGNHGKLGGRYQEVLRLFEKAGLKHKVYCLALSKEGFPKHPLYLNRAERAKRLDK